MFKKIITIICVVVLLAGAVIGVRSWNSHTESVALYTNTDEEVISNDDLESIVGSGYVLTQETEKLQLFVSLDDGNIKVLNKDNGYVWRSAPTEEELARETSNKLWKNNLRSPVMFTYTTQTSSTDTKYSNVFSQDSQISVFKIAGGTRVYIEFLENNVTFGYDMYLEEDGLRVDIPSYLISDPGEVYKENPNGTKTLNKKASCLVVDFYLFPTLGAARSDMGIDGYMLIPDGMGALMYFNSETYANSQYIAHVYGSDMALYNGFDTQLENEANKPTVNYPVFGVVREGNTMLAVIDEGETQADIIASKAGVQTGFNTVNARFVYRMKYKVITNSASGTGYLSYTDFSVKEKRSIKYYFGIGTYVDMAQTYRNYLCDKYGLQPMKAANNAATLQLYFVGGDIESSITGNKFIAMTTFKQAKEMLSYFIEQGIPNIDVVYSGWGKKGESTLVPDRFPVAKQLGGADGLTELCSWARENGINIYLTDDHLSLDSHKGISLTRSAIYNIQNNPLFDGAFSNASYLLKNYETTSLNYKKYGIAGIEETGIGTFLISDYSKAYLTSREEMKAASKSVLKKMKEDFGIIRLASGRCWELMDGAIITALEGTSYLTIIDESVPFYTIALHGIVEYLCGDYMNFYEQREQLLEAVAKGGSISFTLSYEGAEKLSLADSASYYSTQFELWKDDVVNVWNELEEYNEQTYGRLIIGYTVLASGVSCTEYDNGTQVIVNNTDNSYLYLTGDKIAPRSFIVMKGDGV